MNAELWTDGACFGNPGPMGLGIVLKLENGGVIERSIPFGQGTNNIAEYSALIAGMNLAVENGVTELSAYLDSDLVVRQMKGEWRVKDANLQQLWQEAQHLAKSFTALRITHVRREFNTRADTLSKAAAEQVQ